MYRVIRVLHVCRILEKLEKTSPADAAELANLVASLARTRRRLAREYASMSTLYSFELEDYLPGDMLRYSIYELANYNFDLNAFIEDCMKDCLGDCCSQYKEAYKHWLRLLDEFNAALAWLRLAPRTRILEDTRRGRKRQRQKQMEPPARTLLDYIAIRGAESRGAGR